MQAVLFLVLTQKATAPGILPFKELRAQPLEEGGVEDPETKQQEHDSVVQEMLQVKPWTLLRPKM